VKGQRAKSKIGNRRSRIGSNHLSSTFNPPLFALGPFLDAAARGQYSISLKGTRWQLVQIRNHSKL
jgi:hypothetical protein